MNSNDDYPPLPPIPTGLSGRCPRCGSGKMFKGYLSLRDKCQACGLDFSFADSADGPAVFVSFIVGFIVVGLALIVELSYMPPFWVHIVLWLPLIVILGLACLRPLKGMMIALQFAHKAREGEIG